MFAQHACASRAVEEGSEPTQEHQHAHAVGRDAQRRDALHEQHPHVHGEGDREVEQHKRGVADAQHQTGRVFCVTVGKEAPDEDGEK